MAKKHPKTTPTEGAPAAEQEEDSSSEEEESESEDAQEKSTTLKRASEKENNEMAKRVKTEEDPKKELLFQRLWTDSDEIAVLEGMIEYSTQKSVKPTTDIDGFLDFIHNSIHFDVTRRQLSDKIRRLKKRYETRLNKGKRGEMMNFSNQHEDKCYDLSTKIWGTTLKIEEEEEEEEEGNMKVDGNIGELGKMSMDEFIEGPGLELVDNGKRQMLEKRWKKLHVAYLELFVEKSELLFDQSKLVLDAFKTSNKSNK